MNCNSKIVTSNQQGLHPNLHKTVQRHLHSEHRKPISAHSLKAFEQAQAFVAQQNKAIILDSCCGTGESTHYLARHHPDCCVIGIDKSLHRLGKHQAKQNGYLLLRADLNDFWRLAARAGWKLHYHYILYPNPWPKSAHLQRRWHGSAVFPTLLALGGILELRSNWKTYVDEFVEALRIATYPGQTEAIAPAEQAITAFERKYQLSGHDLWRCRVNLEKTC